ncbi:hypothetical protein [Planifilum fimeticola]
MRQRIFWLFILCVLLAGCQADWLSLQAVNERTETQKEEEKKKEEEEAIRKEKEKW